MTSEVPLVNFSYKCDCMRMSFSIWGTNNSEVQIIVCYVEYITFTSSKIGVGGVVGLL